MTDARNHVLEIQVNGEMREFTVGLTVEGLVLALDLPPARVAIELNRNIVRRNEWAGTTLHHGDRVEIVHFVGGGSEAGPRGRAPGFDFSAASVDSSVFSLRLILTPAK
jgi:thiamine biosynthesis protein ThiS